MDFSIEQLLQSIQEQPTWAFFVVFMVAFLESLAIIGVLVPGWLILVGVGVLVGHGQLDFYSMIAAMFIGAVVGEGLSFWLGRYYRDKIRHLSWFESHQSALAKADKMINEFGVLSIYIGRFVGPIRAILPVVIGASLMPRRTFWTANILSGIIWAPLYLLPGILVGVAVTLTTEVKQTLLVTVFILAIFVFLARHWWVKYKSSKSSVDLTKFLIAIAIAILVFVVFALSNEGQILVTALEIVIRGIH